MLLLIDICKKTQKCASVLVFQSIDQKFWQKKIRIFESLMWEKGCKKSFSWSLFFFFISYKSKFKRKKSQLTFTANLWEYTDVLYTKCIILFFKLNNQNIMWMFGRKYATAWKTFFRGVTIRQVILWIASTVPCLMVSRIRSFIDNDAMVQCNGGN